MGDPLDDIGYLVASENRVRILRSLRVESADRRTLHDKTGNSQATLSRVLGGFQDRGWVTRTGRTYRVTSLGELLADEFESLVNTVETVETLEDLINYLPTDEIDFALTRLRGATITTPTQNEPTATLRRATKLVRGADEFRFLTNAIVSPTAEALREQTVQGELTIVGVITDTLLDAVRDSPEFGELTREMIESGQAEFYCYDGSISQTLGLADGTTAVIAQIDKDGNMRAQIESDDEHVCSWVASTIEDHRHESEPISAEAFTV